MASTMCKLRMATKLDGIVKLTSEDRANPEMRNFMLQHWTQHSTPPWRMIGIDAWYFGLRGDAGY